MLFQVLGEARQAVELVGPIGEDIHESSDALAASRAERLTLRWIGLGVISCASLHQRE